MGNNPRFLTSTRKFPINNPKCRTNTPRRQISSHKFQTSTHNSPIKPPRPVTKALLSKEATLALPLAVHPIHTLATTLNAHHHMFTVRFIQNKNILYNKEDI